MGEIEDERRRLALLIEQRRRSLGLSVRAAAQDAGIDRATWSSAEVGDRRTAEYNYAGIERVLAWAPGSIDAVLRGEGPTVLPTPPATTGRSRPSRPDHIAEWETSIINEIWAHPTFSVETKEELTARVRAKAAETRAIEDRLRRTA